MFSAISSTGSVRYATGVNSQAVEQRARQVDGTKQTEHQAKTGADKGTTKAGANGKPAQTGQTGKNEINDLSTEQQRQVDELARTDREVRAHEQAHIAAGGSLVRGAASFEYQSGPDGKRYAVAGEVSIDTTPVKDDPGATMRKAYRIQRAALAPAEPSPQDRRVAAEAASMAVQAQAELAKKTYEGSSESSQNKAAPQAGAIFGIAA